MFRRIADTLAVVRTAGLKGARRLQANADALKQFVRPYSLMQCLIALEKRGLIPALESPAGLEISARPDLDQHLLTAVCEYLFENDVLDRAANGVFRVKDTRRFEYLLDAMYSCFAYHEPGQVIDKLISRELEYGTDVVRSGKYDAIASATLTSKFSYGFASKAIATRHAQSLLDLGCGTGQFLPFLASAGFTGALYGMDLSAEAIQQGKNNGYESSQITLFSGDLMDLSSSVRQVKLERVDIVSMMFVLHEFGDHDVLTVIGGIKSTFPEAEILLTELIERPSEELRRSRERTVFPELKLVHLLSKQILRTPEQWRSIMTDIGYRPVKDRRNDRTNHVALLFAPS